MRRISITLIISTLGVLTGAAFRRSASVQQVIERYRKQFDQESVPWEAARVCVSS